MNLRQLRFIAEVARQGLNVSSAAESLFTSQPGVSKQIRQLEDELGVLIFERRGKQLTRITPAGKAVIEYANRALIEVAAIKEAAQEFSDPGKGTLSIATTHTQARYYLPRIIEQFAAAYPRVDIHLHQGTPVQIAEMLEGGKVEFAIATEGMEYFEELLMLPCYHWRRALVVPLGHPLSKLESIRLNDLAEFALVTYVFGFTGKSQLDKAFRAKSLKPKIALTATDTDVIKTYVRQGSGVGIIAKLAYDPKNDADLQLLEVDDLFEASTTSMGFRRGTFLRNYMYDFMELFAPHLKRDLVDTSLRTKSKGALRSMFMDIKLPTY